MPLLHHDIPGEIPERSRRVVREAYSAWWVSTRHRKSSGPVAFLSCIIAWFTLSTVGDIETSQDLARTVNWFLLLPQLTLVKCLPQPRFATLVIADKARDCLDSRCLHQSIHVLFSCGTDLGTYSLPSSQGCQIWSSVCVLMVWYFLQLNEQVLIGRVGCVLAEWARKWQSKWLHTTTRRGIYFSVPDSAVFCLAGCLCQCYNWFVVHSEVNMPGLLCDTWNGLWHGFPSTCLVRADVVSAWPATMLHLQCSALMVLFQHQWQLICRDSGVSIK